MATKPVPKTSVIKPPEKLSASRAVANWDEELAKQAAEAAETESSTTTGAMFSLKAGILAFNDSPMLNNEMAVIIVDSILENIYYQDKYNSENPLPPTCFAMGRKEPEMVPHDAVIEREQQQNDTCSGCQWNAYGSADVGKGKACRNTRRLAMIPAGLFDKSGKFEAIEDVGIIEREALAFMKLPVTSTTAWAGYVNQLAAAKRPPHGVFTKIKVVPDAKSQFKVTFEALGFVPNDLMGAVMARNAEAKLVIARPYNLDVEERAAPPSRSRAPASKTVIKAKRKF